MGGGEIVALGATSKGSEGKMDEGRWESLFGGAMWWTDDSGELWYARTPRAGMVNPAPAGFVAGASQEIVRLIDDVQKNRNRPEELP